MFKYDQHRVHTWSWGLNWIRLCLWVDLGQNGCQIHRRMCLLNPWINIWFHSVKWFIFWYIWTVEVVGISHVCLMIEIAFKTIRISRPDSVVILQKSYLFDMNELRYESYIFEKVYVSPKFDMNKVSCDFAHRYVKNVDFQKWSGFGWILQTCLANVINHSFGNFKSQTLYPWKGLWISCIS